MKIDLRTVVIPDERRIWVVHPGKHKKFFSDFEQNGRIYLEYPDLNLSEKLLEDDDELRRRIRYSIEVDRYEGFVRPDGTQIRIADFEGDATTNVAVYLRTIRHMFSHMMEGDLVIVPGWGSYSRVLFGEVVGPINFSEKDRIYPNTFADTHYRRVRWLSVNRTKPELRDLVKYVSKPPAVAEVGRGIDTDRFFDYAYDTYVNHNQSWSTIVAPEYKSDDPSAIADSVKLVEFAVATFWATQAGINLSSMSVDDIIEKFYSKQDIEYFGISYASPGRVDFKARNKMLSIWVAMVIGAASVGGLAGCKASGAPIEVTNSATSSQQLNAQMKGQIEILVQQIDQPTVEKVDKLGLKAARDTGLDSPVEVKK